MDIIGFSETLLVGLLLTVIRCQFAEEMFKYAVVGDRIDLYCEPGNETDADWFFKNQTNQTNRYSIYADKTILGPHIARYSVTVKSNQTTILSAEKVDSTYAGTYECEHVTQRRVLKSIRLMIITPTLCNSNDNVSAVGNTSHELYCSFSVAQNISSEDWPTELCVNGAQWNCQIISSYTDDPLYFGCSATGKLFTEYALNLSRTSLLVDASHQCASTSLQNTSTSTINDKQIIIVVCSVVGGFTLLTILSVAMLTRMRNCRKRRPRGRTGNTHQNENGLQIEDFRPEAVYNSIDDSPAYAEVSRGPRRLIPAPDAIYSDSDTDSILRTANSSTVGVDLYGELRNGDVSAYSMCTA